MVLANGVWHPLEWFNPPMKLGVEYRTTERDNGRPVYRKKILYGAGPAAGAANINMRIDSNVEILAVHVKAQHPEGWSQFLDHFANSISESPNSGAQIALTGAGDLSEFTLYAEVKYCKAV